MPTAETPAKRSRSRRKHGRVKSRKSAAKRRDLGPDLNGRVMFEVSKYDGPGKKVEISRLLPLAEALAISLDGYDSVYAPCFHQTGYIDPNTKKRVEISSGFGPVQKKFLETIQDFPGVFMDAQTLYDLAQIDGVLDPGILPTIVLRGRRKYREAKDTAHFILTAGGCVAWAPDRTWIRVTLFVKKNTAVTASGGNGHTAGPEVPSHGDAQPTP